MPQYQVAMVQFKENGRMYPVNCSYEAAKVGDYVLVFMNDDKKSYTRARIAKLDENYWRKPCKNTIVALGDEIKTYVEPGSVNNRYDLEAYLLNLKFNRYEIHLSDDVVSSRLQNKYKYIYSLNLNQKDDADVIPYKVLVAFNEEHVFYGYISENDNLPMWTRTGRILPTVDGKVAYRNLPNMLRSTDMNHIAYIVQDALTIIDLDPNGEPDNWSRSMRQQLGDDGNGAVYLSDGVWI